MSTICTCGSPSTGALPCPVHIRVTAVASEAEAVERRKYQRRAADRSGGLLAACKTTLSFLRSVRVSDSSDPLQAIQDRVHGPVRRRLEEAIAAAERLEPQPEFGSSENRMVRPTQMLFQDGSLPRPRLTYSGDGLQRVPQLDRLDAVREKLAAIKQEASDIGRDRIACTVEEIEELLNAK